MSDIKQRVIRTIAEQLGIEASQVTEDKRLVADLGADSLDEIELLMAIEDEFGLEIENHLAERVQTVGDAIQLIGQLDAV